VRLLTALSHINVHAHRRALSDPPQSTMLARASAWGVLLGVMFIERAMFVP
jgi:predicted anti-sigma-YlaC factor YlaD